MAPAAHAIATPSATATLLRDASIEVASHHPGAAARLTEWFAPGTEVYVNFLPGADEARTVGRAAALRSVGFVPVPHIAARNLSGTADLSELLARLAGEAGVDRILAIGGDMAVPRGRFASTLDMLATGVLPQHGIKAVGFGGYPEDHPILSPEAMQSALRDKLTAARAQGLQTFVVTQFCFEAQPVLQWLRQLRASGAAVPVRIGVAGPASLRTLITFAMKCGIGTSLRVLLNQPQYIGRLLRDAAPDELVHELGEGLRALHAAGVGLHFFPFGGVAKTAEWRRHAMG